LRWEKTRDGYRRTRGLLGRHLPWVLQLPGVTPLAMSPPPCWGGAGQREVLEDNFVPDDTDLNQLWFLQVTKGHVATEKSRLDDGASAEDGERPPPPPKLSCGAEVVGGGEHVSGHGGAMGKALQEDSP